MLTHWDRVTHICVSKINTIGSDNGLSPGRRQAIIWTNDDKSNIFIQENALENVVCEMEPFHSLSLSYNFVLHRSKLDVAFVHHVVDRILYFL